MKISDNLLDNPNFAPAGDWDETGHTWDIITHPWQLIQPKERQYRLEMIPPGEHKTCDWENDFNNNNNNDAILCTDGLYHARWFSIGHCENITR